MFFFNLITLKSICPSSLWLHHYNLPHLSKIEKKKFDGTRIQDPASNIG